MRSGTTKEHKHTQIVAEGESKSVSEQLRMEQRDRKEVIHEALAEEVRRGEQRKKRSDRAAVEPRENPIEPEVNPKRRLLMKSASLTASGSGQQEQKKSIPDDEWRMQVEDTPETLAKARRCLQHRQRTPDGELL